MMDMMYRWGFVHRPWRCHRHAGDNSRGYYGRWGRSSRIGVSMMMHRRWNNTTRKNNKKFSLWKAEISLKSRTVYNLRIFTLSIWMADEIASDFNFAFVFLLVVVGWVRCGSSRWGSRVVDISVRQSGIIRSLRLGMATRPRGWCPCANSRGFLFWSRIPWIEIIPVTMSARTSAKRTQKLHRSDRGCFYRSWRRRARTRRSLVISSL